MVCMLACARPVCSALSMNKISIFHHRRQERCEERNRKTTLIPHPSAAFDALTQFLHRYRLKCLDYLGGEKKYSQLRF